MGVTVADERPYEIRGARRRAGVDLRLRAAPRRGRDLEPDAVREAFQDAFARGLAGRDRRTTASTSSCSRPASTAREIALLRAVREVPAPDGDAVQPGVHGGDARRPSRDRGAPGRAVPARLDPAVEDRDASELDRTIVKSTRCRHQPRRGPHPAQLPQGDPGRPAHELVPARCPREPEAVPLASSSIRSSCPTCPCRARSSRSSSTRRASRAIHLRGGRVARGGIRWSDRPRRLPHRGPRADEGADREERGHRARSGPRAASSCKRSPADRDGSQARGRRLLPHVHRGPARPHRQPRRRRGRSAARRRAAHDGDDPYLVVAADKGTATFSDIANEIAADYGFWLGDAFASGGSTGYDHKEMGITARGAWESVKRHFRELGVDADTTDDHGRRHRRHVGRRVRQRHAAARRT